MSVIIRNSQHRIRLSVSSIENAVREIQVASGYPLSAVGIHIADNAFITEMNAQYRNTNRPTDILSFGANEFRCPEDFVDPLYADEGIIDLGDMILSAEYIVNYAKSNNLDIEQHWLTILTHGFVHLLGYDHENDSDFQIMHSKETSILSQLHQIDREPMMQ